jgi:predicted phage terminase large subunit-like protein
MTPQEAAIELLTRRKARRSYLDYLGIASTEGQPAAHHRLMIERLQAVADGHCKRLMLFLPPGSAKSYYGNVMFSAWWLGRNPRGQLLTASYGQEVADKWGRRVKSVIRTPEHLRVFGGHEISRSSDAAGRWATTTGGEYYAVGAGGAITSYRADIAIIDDPIKGREEADSATIKDKLREWYKSDFWTRLKPNAPVVLIMTRWADDDLAGWLLDEAKAGGEQWDVVSVPMEAGPGDPLGRALGERLWADWFTEEMVREAKRDRRRWSALYQQTPAPDEGIQFRGDWFQRFRLGDEPQGLRYYMASDFAVKPDDGDYTEHGVFGVDHHGRWWLVDWWYGQTSSNIWIDSACDLIQKWRPMLWAAEGGVIRHSVESFLIKRMQERRTYCKIEWLNSIKDKPIRARSFEARAAMHMVYLPRVEWGDRLLDQLLRFPAGKHDDAVDVCSLMARAIDSMTAAPYPAEEIKPRRVMRWDKEPDDDLDSWRTL